METRQSSSAYLESISVSGQVHVLVIFGWLAVRVASEKRSRLQLFTAMPSISTPWRSNQQTYSLVQEMAMSPRTLMVRFNRYSPDSSLVTINEIIPLFGNRINVFLELDCSNRTTSMCLFKVLDRLWKPEMERAIGEDNTGFKCGISGPGSR